jgi:hypothetical protein
MSHFCLIEAVEVEGLGGGGVVAAAFGDVQVADGTHMRERDSQREGSSDCP